MNRRGFLGSILAAGYAPAAISSGVLMPIKTIFVPGGVYDIPFDLSEVARLLRETNEILMDAILVEQPVLFTDRQRYEALSNAKRQT